MLHALQDDLIGNTQMPVIWINQLVPPSPSSHQTWYPPVLLVDVTPSNYRYVHHKSKCWPSCKAPQPSMGHYISGDDMNKSPSLKAGQVKLSNLMCKPNNKPVPKSSPFYHPSHGRCMALGLPHIHLVSPMQ